METTPLRCGSLARVLSCRIAKCTNAITPITEYEYLGNPAKGCKRITSTGKPIKEFYSNALTNSMSEFMSECPQQLADQLSCLIQLDRLLLNTERTMSNTCLRDSLTVAADGFDTALGSVGFPIHMSALECANITEPFEEEYTLAQFNSKFVLKATNDTVLVSDLPAGSSLKRMCDIAQIQFTRYLGNTLIFI